MTGGRVTVWRLDVLAGSETFIRDQVDAFLRWTPTLLGSLAVTSPLSRPQDRIVFDRSVGDRWALWWAAWSGRSARVRRALAATSPDVVIAHFVKDAWMIRRAARRLGVPLVVVAHGYDVTALAQAPGATGRAYRRRARASFAAAHRIVAISEFIREQLLIMGAPPEKITVLRMGVALPPAPAPLPHRWDVAFIGRLVPKKGVLDLLAALAMSPTPVRCIIVGDGPDRAAAEEHAREHTLDVTFTGHLPPEEVDVVLRSSRLLVAPSRRAEDGDSEGLGMVFLEAAARGVPAVAYDHGGVSEAVISGRTGHLVPEGDTAALGAAIAGALSDDALLRQWGEQAREHATGFDIRDWIVRWEAMLDAVRQEASAAITADT